MLQDIKIKLVTCGSHQFGIFDQKIGQGGSAVVKKGYNKKYPKQLFAVKIVNIKNEQNKQLALKQLQIMQQLPTHPNLVRIQKIKVQSLNNIYIFMEFCNDGTLFDLANKRYLSQQQIYDLFCQLMRGYKVMYDNKILHQDIKLENILIHNGIYKISDFGLAITCENYKYGTKRKGTLSYMPYQKLTKKDYIANSKCDIYSFGIVFYQIICRRHPYINKKVDSPSWVKAFKEAELKNDILGKYTLRFRSFFEIILKMVAKMEDQRISFEELWNYYETSEQLAPFRVEKEKGVAIVPQIPEKYSVIATSQASIMSFDTQAPEIVQMKKSILFNRKIAQLIEVIIKSIQNFKSNQQQKQIDELEFLLCLTRSLIMKSLVIDWFNIPESTKQEFEKYEQDSKFVQQQFMDYLSQNTLSEQSKARMGEIKSLPSNTQLFNYVKIYIMNLFKNRFTIVRINHSKEIQLLFYLISFVDLLENEQITLEMMENFQREGEEDKKVKAVIEEFSKNENVMIDADQYPNKQESDEEFEQLVFDE